MPIAATIAIPPQTKAATVTDDDRWLEPLEKDSPEAKAWSDVLVTEQGPRNLTAGLFEMPDVISV